jgi:rubrerythrin
MTEPTAPRESVSRPRVHTVWECPSCTRRYYTDRAPDTCPFCLRPVRQ